MTKKVAVPHDPRQLEAAFAQFNAVSGQLIDAYSQLEAQVHVLNAQLEAANSQLRSKMEENAALAERLSRLLSALPAGVVEMDAVGCVRHENPAAARMLGRSTLGLCWQQVETLLEATELTDTYLVPGDEDGPARRVSLQYQDLPEQGGRIVLMHDVTRLHQLSGELANQQRLAAMGSMAASLAHQLRTPLATAMLYTANLRNPGLAEAERSRFIDKSLARLKALEGLIQNMLSFVRGHVSELEGLDAAGLAEEVRAIMAPLCQARDVALDCQVGVDSAITVSGDRKALSGALLNLLENALFFTPSGGQVGLGVRQTGGQVMFEVTDTGPGLSAEVKARMFEPFFTTRSGGTGLGLAIVKKVAEELAGTVSCENRPEGGARFVLSLPAATAGPTGAREKA
ncbi:His Kinase A (phospho-acceptor) domain/Histidine kinase-, DNA gyrase B-, and HSP90-like ATPase [Gulbenkiania indica]|uniref:histidine kinase n=2 Tax=Gulbenkiania TaxID=397456 RepID=A0A0K6GRV7_9NEIS|nr:two-component system sensor histidine kinase FlrB [Gulbenkiania mobilis]CUA81455.1 His Kinase A (phospho-acceptor) domain/Histidine kinase-, DNA gyrase B-, and HSP90-like ATPase [Gulbenkiania indica]